jgi:phosphate transport system protein
VAISVRSSFTKRLVRLHEDVLQLGNMARSAVATALITLSEADVERAAEVISLDMEINNARYGVESQCYALIATEQPVAGDLRSIVTALTVSSELERVGDHGKKIARVALRMADTPRPFVIGDIPRMGQASLSLLDRALRTYGSRDVGEARSICQGDDLVDAFYQQIFSVLLARMLESPRAIGAATQLIQVAHELERVGDRATIIAERVIYSVTGELIDTKV